MILSKLFEVRDSGTFIPVLATAIIRDGSEDDQTQYLLSCAGWHSSPVALYVTRMSDAETQFDIYSWKGGARTMPAAHQHIQENWDSLVSGQVIDVEFILGIKPAAKTPQRLDR